MGLAASFVTPSPKNEGNGNQFVDDEPFIDKRKPSSATVAKGVSNNGEHIFILVMAKMIHSAVWDSERFVLKDGQPLHMVKLVGAVRNFRGNIKHGSVFLVLDGSSFCISRTKNGKEKCECESKWRGRREVGV